MKITVLLVLIFVLAVPVAHADLLDVGTVADTPAIFASQQWQYMMVLTSFDLALHGIVNDQYVNGWYTSQPGYNTIYTMPGGTYFDTDIFSADGPASQAQVSWDFTGNSYSLRLIVVGMVSPDRQYAYHFYEPLRDADSRNLGTAMVDAANGWSIREIGFFGYDRNVESIPEPSSLSLLVVGLIFICVFVRKSAHLRAKNL